MGTALVVVGDIPLEHSPQVSLVDDQESVGDLASDCADESFGVAVRSRAARRNPHSLNTGAGEDSVERCRELASPIANKEPETVRSIVEVDEQVAGLLCGPWPVGMRCGTEDVDVAGGDFKDEEHVDPLERHRA